VIRLDLVVEPEDDIHRSRQVVKRLANRGELLKALAIFDASHFHEGSNRRSVDALKHPGGYKAGVCGDLAKHLVEMLGGKALVRRIHGPDVDKNGAFLHRRTSFLEFDATDVGVVAGTILPIVPAAG
jgi:hypothetical protein